MTNFKIRYIIVLLFPVIASLIAVYLAKIEYVPRGIGFYELGLIAGFSCGLLALLYKYCSARPLYYALILLPIVLAFALYASLGRHISIFATLLPSIAFVLVSYVMIRYIMYLPALMRMRPVLMGLVGAPVISSYYAALSQLMGREISSQLWQENLMNGLIIYVFISFGLSMAELIIVRSEVKELQKTQDAEDDA
ncbi:MAG: hypothetical protein PHC50_10530 [Candidatus Cloacimonetes bacterium]|nr:hypothetical protein [Candidatus Cloacimonadota bacterium]